MGMQRRRECLFFPHNNRGIHGHPAPHQSTERNGGIEALRDWKEEKRDWLAGGKRVNESKRNALRV